MKTFLLLIASIVFLTFSCSNESDSGKLKLVPCTTSDDCTNGLKCLNGFCKKEENNVECQNNEQCPTGFECVENKCSLKPCSSKEDCGVGLICFNSKCIPGCETNEDCIGDEICNVNTRICESENKKDCRKPGEECEQGYECNQMNGECVLKTTCNIDEDCMQDSRCEDHTCVPRVACVAENNGAECAEGEICRPDGFCGVDTGCNNDDYCLSKDPSKPACNINSGICYECVNDSYCPDDKKCDLDRYVCGDADSLVCHSDEDCGLNRKCQEDGTCVSMFGPECQSDSDCTDLTRGKCLTSTDPHRCVQCLQDEHCEEGQICNRNTNLCENMGSGASCTDDSECDILAGESCVNGQCYNPNASGNDGAEGLCDMDYGGTLCILFGGSCNGDLLTNPNCTLDPLDLLCGDCVFDE